MDTRTSEHITSTPLAGPAKTTERKDPVIILSGFSLFSFQTLRHFISIKVTPDSIKKCYYKYPFIPKDIFEHIIFDRIG